MSFLIRHIWKIVIASVALGLVLLIIGTSLGGLRRDFYFDRQGVHVDYNEEHRINEDIPGGFTGIDIDVDYFGIEFIKSDKYAIDMSYYGNQEAPIWKIENGTLKIYRKETRRYTFFNFNFNSIFDKNIAKIYLPPDAEFGNVSIKTDAGTISAGGFKAENADIGSSFGAVDVFDVTSDKLKLDLAAGRFKAENLQVGTLEYKNDFGSTEMKDINAKTLRATVSSGEFTLNGCETEDITVKSSFGKINLNNIVSSGTDVTASSGQITVSGNFSGYTKIDSDFGKISFTTSRPKDDYSYNIYTSFGKVSVDNETYRGDSSVIGGNSGDRLSIHASSGDIDVYFNKG